MEYIYIFIVIKLFFFISCVSVFYVSKTLHAVFMLISSFVLAACICIFLEAYFVAFLLVIVYVGAVAVLFLFALMLINFVDPARVTQFEITKKVVVLFLSIFFFLLGVACTRYYVSVLVNDFSFVNFFIYQPNMFVISQLLYSYNSVAFILSGLILFVAMLGAIVLTASSRGKLSAVYKQDISQQVGTQPSDSVVLKIPKLIN